MDKLLKLYTYVDGGANDTPFPDADNQIEIGEFRYDAKRMGGAPTITASVYYSSCLDEVWTDSVYAEFNGEKYYLKQVPTSSYSNEDSRYKHDLELVSERIALDNVYFYDTVSDEAEGDDKPVSNSTKFVFHGDIHEFASRLGHSLAQSGLDYTVHVDTGVSSESLLISFENAFFSNAIQEAYNTYNIPYYFVGKEIHFGLAGNNIEEVLAYGVDDALLSITKSNANYKIVNRATGTGSSENIPFYYPNNSPKGEIELTVDSSAVFVVIDDEKFANNMDIDEVITLGTGGQASVSVPNGSYDGISTIRQDAYAITIQNMQPQTMWFFVPLYVNKKGRIYIGGGFNISDRGYYTMSQFVKSAELYYENIKLDVADGVVDCGTLDVGSYTVKIGFSFGYLGTSGYEVTPAFDTSTTAGGWARSDGKEVALEDLGIKMVAGTPSGGDTLKQTLVRYIKTSANLLPSIYRETYGAERFYNAVNGEYTDENGEDIVFANPYIAGRPKEHIITVEDIKPTIKETVVNGLRIDMFSEFAYDEDDNDETYEDEEGNVYFKHPYFYGKLRVMDFNLFDQAIEQQPMTISFTSGDVGACNFEIGVTEDYPQKNPVQVDEDGNLVRDENGMIVAGVEGTQQQVTTFQDRQQDTSKYEVWIALRKEEETYGILMPQSLHKPKACSEGQNDGDTFVILGINLPKSYILNAEEKLEREIIKYIKENNEEKFKFSITFSRIYFEENPDVLALLNENSALKVSYNGSTYDLYVSSFSYTMSEGDALPEIRVELDDTLQVTQNALQNAISEVKSQIGSVVREVNSQVAIQQASYIKRQADDEAYGKVNFTKGLKFGEGGKVEILDNNSAKLTIEYLEVTKKATFTSLEIQEKTHVGGQILVTPASMNCGEVEELDDAYRCYFQTKGADGGEEIFNQFAIGDQAICQTFNAWGSKYYWRLVTAIGEDYIDLSKTDCDEGSGVPSAGDKIIQMGNRNDEARQNAIVIAAYGDGSPYIIQYKGINDYDLPTTDGEDDRIMTMLSPTKNILTGMVRMQAGSEGLENFAAWTALQEEVAGKVSAEDISGYEYLVQALQQPTEVLGGLILTSNIQLRDSDGSIRSGINGIYDANATGGGIAAWFGGTMSEESAKTVLRFDGSGFFANKNITWDNEGGASFAGGKITINPQGALVLSDDIAFGSSEDETINSIITKLSEIMSWFTLEDGTLTTRYNLVVEGDTSSGGEGEDTPSGGGGIDEEQLAEYLESNNYVNSVAKITSILGYTPANGANYLPLAGGTIDGNSVEPLIINSSASSVGIRLRINGANKAYIGYGGTSVGTYMYNYDSGYYIGIREGVAYFNNGAYNTLIHSGNIGSQKVAGLVTPRTIWGQSFDGTGNVTGALHMPNNTNIKMAIADGTAYCGVMYLATSNELAIGNDVASSGFNTLLSGNEVRLRYGTSRTNGLILNSSGNVGIGKTSPQYKLDVAGTGRFTGGVVVDWSGHVTPLEQVGANLGTATTMWNRTYTRYIDTSSTYYLRFCAGGTEYMQLTDTGRLNVSVHIMPNVHNSFAIGDYSNSFNVIHANIFTSGASNNNLWLVGGASASSVGIQFARNSEGNTAGKMGSWDATGLYPATNSAYSLGTSSYRWSTIYGATGNFSANVVTPTIYGDKPSGASYNRWRIVSDSSSNGVFFQAANYAGTSTAGNMYLTGYNASALAKLAIKATTTSVSGDLIVSGDTSSGSDIRFKDIIKDKTLKIADIAKAPLFTFKWNDREDDVIHLGSSAQYWEKVCPWLVSGEDFKTLNYGVGAMGGVISLARHELQQDKKIKAQGKEIKALKRKVKDLETKIRRMEYGG